MKIALTSLGVNIVGLLLMSSAGAAQSQPVPPGTDVHGDPLPDGALVRIGTLRWRHAGAVTYVAFPPDANTVLTAGRDDVIRIWDRKAGKEFRRFSIPTVAVPPDSREPNSYPPSFAISQDGKLLAALSRKNEIIYVWDAATGKLRLQVSSTVLDNRGLTSGVAVVFSPDGKTLALRMIDRGVLLLDTQTGKTIRQIKFQPRKAGQGVIAFVSAGDGAGIAFSQDSKTLATVESEPNDSHYVKLVGVETGKVRIIDSPKRRASGLAFSADGKYLAYGTFKSIHICSAETSKELRRIKSPMTTAKLLCFAPDGKTIAAKGIDLSVEVFDVESAASLGRVRAPAHDAKMYYYPGVDEGRDVCFSRDGKTIAGADRHTVRFYDAPSRR
ncbi:MAG: hypothetical protein FJ271_30615 [Planctomycetes bacterium]|nr:hypothetical protein [Planctomycetota bacterium]